MRYLLSVVLSLSLAFVPTWGQMQQKGHQTYRFNAANGFTIEILATPDEVYHVTWISPWAESVSFRVSPTSEYLEILSGEVKYRTIYDQEGMPEWDEALEAHPDGTIEVTRSAAIARQVEEAKAETLEGFPWDLRALDVFVVGLTNQASQLFWDEANAATVVGLQESSTIDGCSDEGWNCVFGLMAFLAGYIAVVALCGGAAVATGGLALLGCVAGLIVGTPALGGHAGIACARWDACRKLHKKDDPDPDDPRKGDGSPIVPRTGG